MAAETNGAAFYARAREHCERLKDLEPEAGARILGWLMVCALYGFGRLRIVSGRRSLGEQERLYGQGRTREECAAAGVPPDCAHPEARRVTWCSPEESLHVQGKAVDVDYADYGRSHRERIWHLARTMGLECGSDWKVRDDGHIQFAGGK